MHQTLFLVHETTKKFVLRGMYVIMQYCVCVCVTVYVCVTVCVYTCVAFGTTYLTFTATLFSLTCYINLSSILTLLWPTTFKTFSVKLCTRNIVVSLMLAYLGDRVVIRIAL